MGLRKWEKPLFDPRLACGGRERISSETIEARATVIRAPGGNLYLRFDEPFEADEVSSDLNACLHCVDGYMNAIQLSPEDD